MKIATLKAHTASVCTLSTINESGKTKMLVSGSDVGCSTLIFWDINTWTIKSKIHAHSAAITSIVDLGDGQTLVSGSYDKLINIYNYKRA
jgi:WD40 repeat protein